MAAYPKDRFDRMPEDLQRVGAHRAPKTKGRGWIGLLLALLATGALVFAGLYGLSRFLGVDIGLPIFAEAPTPRPTPTPTPTAQPLTDPTKLDPARGVTVSVLNGTPLAGLQDTVGAQLTAAGWPIKSVAPASESDIQETTVYYSDALNEDVARGLVVGLGIGRIRLVSADTFPGAAITIVLGSDYKVPTPAP
jgi:hypothetical protein